MDYTLVRGKAVSDPVSVTDFNSIARGILQNCDSLRDVWVRGEISNLTKASSGHYYFTMKDGGSELRCTLFRGAAQRLTRPPQDKEEVIAKGSADLYMARGSYQFNVTEMRPVGIGDLHARFEELKNRLKEEGLFDEARKRPLPRYPDVIGVVTSSTGSVIRDIINVASRRYPCRIILAPAQVQGAGAADSIVRAMGLLWRYGVDVMIVGRGGGSLEDLWPFNEEAVARAIHRSPVPVISAVGHETDYSISDFVADRRAETPSAAAEMALPDLGLEKRHLLQLASKADRSLMRSSEASQREFLALDRMLSPRRAAERLQQLMQRVDDLDVDMARNVIRRSERLSARMDGLTYRISPVHAKVMVNGAVRDLNDIVNRSDGLIRDRLDEAVNRLQGMEGSMNALDPLRVLDRGYCIVIGPNGRPVTSIGDADVDDRVRMRLQDGYLDADIKGKEML